MYREPQCVESPRNFEALTFKSRDLETVTHNVTLSTAFNIAQYNSISISQSHQFSAYPVNFNSPSGHGSRISSNTGRHHLSISCPSAMANAYSAHSG